MLTKKSIGCSAFVALVAILAMALPAMASAAATDPNPILGGPAPGTEEITVPEETAPSLIKPEPLLESCDSGNVCSWTGTYYSGERHEQLCYNNSYNVGTKYSAKNRCANKAVQFGRHEGEVIHYTFCMNPGGDRPEPGWFNWFWVLGEGSRC